MLSQEPVEKKLRRKTNLEDAMILPKVRKKLSYNPAKEKNLHKYEILPPKKWGNSMNFPWFFFIRSTILFRKSRPRPFLRGENMEISPAWIYRVEFLEVANLDAKCPASMEIMLKHFDHILGGVWRKGQKSRSARHVFSREENLPKKNGETKKVGKKSSTQGRCLRIFE